MNFGPSLILPPPFRWVPLCSNLVPEKKKIQNERFFRVFCPETGAQSLRYFPPFLFLQHQTRTSIIIHSWTHLLSFYFFPLCVTPFTYAAILLLSLPCSLVFPSPVDRIESWLELEIFLFRVFHCRFLCRVLFLFLLSLFLISLSMSIWSSLFKGGLVMLFILPSWLR